MKNYSKTEKRGEDVHDKLVTFWWWLSVVKSQSQDSVIVKVNIIEITSKKSKCQSLYYNKLKVLMKNYSKKKK